MNRLPLVFMAWLFACLAPPAAFGALSTFAGDWNNINPGTPGITKLKVGVSGTNVTVHAWGKCHPQDCDWGSVKAYGYAPKVSAPLAGTAQAVSAVYKTGFSETIVILRPVKKRLRAEVYTRFTDNSKRSDYTATELFAKAGGRPALREDCIPFDYRRAVVRQAGNRWKIAVGNMWLKDFGNSRPEAQQGLRVLKHYRMNKQCFVGRPDPSMEYYLTNNRSPAGAMRGEDCVGFNPAKIQVKQIGGRWKIVEGSHWIMDFGGKVKEARQSARIIRHYGFKHMCFVGRPNPSMTYYRR